MHDRRRSNGRSVALGGLEPNLGCGTHSGFIQPVPEPADYAIHVQLTVCAEHYFQQNFAFEVQFPCFGGVNRLGFGNNFHRSCVRRVVIDIAMSGIGGNLLCGKARRLNSLAIAPAVTLPALRNSIPKPRTRNCAFDSFYPTSAITGSSALR